MTPIPALSSEERSARRRDYNEQILAFLGEYLRQNGAELRFAQLIHILNRQEDYFYEEPWETLARFRQALDRT